MQSNTLRKFSAGEKCFALTAETAFFLRFPHQITPVLFQPFDPEGEKYIASFPEVADSRKKNAVFAECRGLKQTFRWKIAEISGVDPLFRRGIRSERRHRDRVRSFAFADHVFIFRNQAVCLCQSRPVTVVIPFRKEIDRRSVVSGEKEPEYFHCDVFRIGKPEAALHSVRQGKQFRALSGREIFPGEINHLFRRNVGIEIVAFGIGVRFQRFPADVGAPRIDVFQVSGIIQRVMLACGGFTRLTVNHLNPCDFRNETSLAGRGAIHRLMNRFDHPRMLPAAESDSDVVIPAVDQQFLRPRFFHIIF